MQSWNKGLPSSNKKMGPQSVLVSLCIDLFHSGWIRFDFKFKYVGVELLQKWEHNLWKDRGIEISELPVLNTVLWISGINIDKFLLLLSGKFIAEYCILIYFPFL